MSGSNGLVKFPQRAPGFLSPARESDDQKALTSMVHGGGSGGLQTFSMLSADQLLPATKIDYAKEVGDGLGSSVLMAPLNWIMRTFPEAPALVEKRNRQKQWEEEIGHPLTNLLRQPNPYYGGLQLLMATVLDLCFGYAYWVKIRNGLGEVLQLWWVPRHLLEPRWSTDGTTFIDHYDYLVGGQRLRIDVGDVVHFRFGMDPRNIRQGLSPLGALVRDIAMDDQAANFATSILKNLGVIGIVISPESSGGGVVGKTAIEETKAFVQERFAGDNRGKALALGAPTKVQMLQYNMQGFDVSPLRDVSEERVCAALGIPAAVVGFGTGLQQTKVGATMKEMRQLAWTGGLIPLQKIVGDEIDRSLLAVDRIYDGLQTYTPPTKRGSVRLTFDTKQVRALWEDTADKHNRVRADYLAGMITRAEARRETGRAAQTGDDVYVQPVNVQQLDATGKPIPAAPPSGTRPADSTTTPDPTSGEDT
jgi:phage portal protein BeeE